MRNLPTLLVLCFVVWGCSPKKPAADGTSSEVTAFRTFKIVQSKETQEQNQIEAQSAYLFTNSGFGELDTLAAKYRASKEANADGSWKLRYIYEGFEPDAGAPPIEWKNRVTLADEWIRKNPDSITARVAKARLLIGYGWAIRGSEYANTVKEEQWTQFYELLRQATKVLHDADKLSERCPVYWTTWQRAALGLQMEREDYDDLFRRAVKEFPDYWYYYYTRVIFLLPRWYGEPGDWEKDLTASADGAGGESGDMLYARVVCYVYTYSGGIDVFEGNRISWERVERGLEGLMKKFPTSIALKNHRAFLAGLAGDKEKARAYFAEIKDECDLSVWHEKVKIENFATWLN
jgi:hypothetical protein